jgi:hypothetical protein
MAGRQTDQKIQAGSIAPQRSPVLAHVITYAMVTALSFWAQGGYAQALKKYVTPDGKVIYSDKPIPDAKLVGEVPAPPPPDPAGSGGSRQREIVRGAEANRLAEKRLKELAEERQRVDEATAKLERAREILNEGRVPKPGERIGTAGGGSRFTDEYLARQQSNEDAVKRAEEELKKAQGR